MAKLYFDGVRSRMFYDHGWWELRHSTEAEWVRAWCAVHKVEFLDHRIENYPQWLREPLLRARAVLPQGCPRLGLRDLERIPYIHPIVGLFVPRRVR